MSESLNKKPKKRGLTIALIILAIICILLGIMFSVFSMVPMPYNKYVKLNYEVRDEEYTSSKIFLITINSNSLDNFEIESLKMGKLVIDKKQEYQGKKTLNPVFIINGKKALLKKSDSSFTVISKNEDTVNDLYEFIGEFNLMCQYDGLAIDDETLTFNDFINDYFKYASFRKMSTVLSVIFLVVGIVGVVALSTIKFANNYINKNTFQIINNSKKYCDTPMVIDCVKNCMDFLYKISGETVFEDYVAKIKVTIYNSKIVIKQSGTLLSELIFRKYNYADIQTANTRKEVLYAVYQKLCESFDQTNQTLINNKFDYSANYLKNDKITGKVSFKYYSFILTELDIKYQKS